LSERSGCLPRPKNRHAGANNQRLYLDDARAAQMSDTLPIDFNAAAPGIGRHVSGVAAPFNGHIDNFRIAHVQRSDGWIETTWNNMSDPGAFAAAGAEEQQGGEPPPLAGAGDGRLPDGVSANTRNGDIALIACLASSWTPPWCGAGTPIRSASCGHGTSCLRSLGVRHPPRPLDRHRRGHLPDGLTTLPKRRS
jgi:hypothetical protein